MSDVENVESVPDPGRTIEGLRDTGYKFVTAVADLVDNSIAAAATKIDIDVSMDYRGRIRLSVADNGTGMDRDSLIAAMRYGSPKRPNPASLGKFGLGLKTASTAFCRCLSLISRPSGELPSLMATWDIDHVVNSGQWLLQMSDQPDEAALQHLDRVARDSSGTVVLWTKVDRLLKNYAKPAGGRARTALNKHRTDLKDHIAVTYQRFLDNRDKRVRNIEISVNGDSIRPWDPFQKSFSELVAKAKRDVEDTGAQFDIKAYILPRREEFPDEETAKAAKLSSDRQGLYIYREGRLIHEAGWLGMYQQEPHGTLLRVEFSFDHRLDDALHLDIKKSQIILNDTLWAWIKDQFLTAPRREANRRYRKGRNDVNINNAENTHDASNKSIGNKEAEIGGPEVNVSDPDTGEVIVKNEHGVFRTTKITISAATKPGQVFVQPVDGIDDGMLFEPALIEGNKAVRINTQHPYYHKVYVPNRGESVTVQGMDSLMWALCGAELSATTDKTAEAFNDMRYEVARILRKLVEDLPDPAIGEEEDAA